MPGGEHEICPVVATEPALGLAQGDHSFAGRGLGEANALAAGLAEMSVMQEPIDRCGGKGFRYQLAKTRWMQIWREGALLVGGPTAFSGPRE